MDKSIKKLVIAMIFAALFVAVYNLILYKIH